MSIEPPLYLELIEFWRAAGPKKWFAHDPSFDQEIRARFADVHFAAARGEFADWGETPEGSLGLLLLIDQFPRNLFRNSAHAFATDAMARHVADHALQACQHLAVDPILKPFFFLPFAHSEAMEDQDRSVALAEHHARETGDENTLTWARMHRELIERFGRFPHRNAMTGRESTAAEQDYLANGGFKG